MLVRNAVKIPENMHQWAEGKAVLGADAKPIDLDIQWEDVNFSSNTHNPVRIRTKSGEEYDISFEALACLKEDWNERNKDTTNA